MRYALILTAALLSGCAQFITIMDEHTPPPSDFPRMAIAFEELEDAEFVKWCPGHADACPRFNFQDRVCIVIHRAWFPDWMREHEMLHCRGYDHYGATSVRDTWEQYKRRKLAAGEKP